MGSVSQKKYVQASKHGHLQERVKYTQILLKIYLRNRKE